MRRTILGSTALAAAVAAVMSFAAPAQATPTLTIGYSLNGGAITTVTGSPFSGGTASPVVTTIAAFPLLSITAFGEPVQPQATLSSNILVNSASTGGTLRVFITQQGIAGPVGSSNFGSGLTSNFIFGNISSVQELTFVDPLNGLFGGTQVGTGTFNGGGFIPTVATSPLLSNPYSETEEYIITSVAGGATGTANVTITMSSVPEPVSMAVLGAGLVGLGVLRRKK